MRRPEAGPLALTEMVEAAAGSVTSHVFLRTGGGVMTVFAFGEGEGLSEHATPHDAVIQVLEGRLHMSMEGEEYELETGESLYIPPSVTHSLHGGEPFKMLLTLIKDGD